MYKQKEHQDFLKHKKTKKRPVKSDITYQKV